MKITPTQIPEVKLIEPVVHGDARGFFLESWNKKTFKDAGIQEGFVQDNHSRSVRNTLRGLHYQVGRPQGKLVRASRGEVFDIAVDIRRSSPTFGQWTGEVLSESNHRMLWIPVGFAHGFYTLSEVSEFQYKCTDYYSPEHERCILWSDPDIAIEWPLLDELPMISDKDSRGCPLIDADLFD